MRLAFIGVGQVGAPLADHLQRLGHAVVVAATDPNSASLQKALARNPQLEVKPPKEGRGGGGGGVSGHPLRGQGGGAGGRGGRIGGEDPRGLHQSGGAQSQPWPRQ